MVVLSLSSVLEATGSHVHDKNMHTLLACSGPIFFLPIILFSFSLICIFLIAFLLSLASASIVSVLYTVVPVMNGHPLDQAKVSVHDMWPLVGGTDGRHQT